MKTCCGCKEELPLASFTKKGAGLQSRCRNCQRAKVREHYLNNTQYYKDKARKNDVLHIKALRAFLLSYFSEHPCLDCGETDPVVLTFDHRNPEVKSFNVGDGLSAKYSVKRMQAEIDKCDVRCFNCHAKRTASQFGWWKFVAQI